VRPSAISLIFVVLIVLVIVVLGMVVLLCPVLSGRSAARVTSCSW
jgi:hypothetical protein